MPRPSHVLSPYFSHSIRCYKYPTTEAADSPVRIMEARIRSRRWVGQKGRGSLKVRRVNMTAPEDRRVGVGLLGKRGEGGGGRVGG